MKDIIGTQWVPTPTRKRLVTNRKRTLRSRSEKAARSVWSECESCMTESRNFVDCQGLPVRVRGDNIARNDLTMDRATRPGSASRADTYWGILGTCEGLPLLGLNYRNGIKPVEQFPGHHKTLLSWGVAKKMKRPRYDHPSLRQGGLDGEIVGRLSRLIVAFESRETLLGRSL